MVQAVPVGGQMLEELAQNHSGSLWMNNELNPGLKCLWPKWTVSQDHLIAKENWVTGWWSMRFWEGEQRALDLCRPDLLSPYPKVSLSGLRYFSTMQLWIVMELLCTHKLNKFMPRKYVYLTFNSCSLCSTPPHICIFLLPMCSQGDIALIL